MGLSRAALRFLVREHRRKPLHGSVLTLGRQCVYATYQELLDICRQEGVSPTALPPDVDLQSNIPAWRGTPLEENTSDVAFFRLLGAGDVHALDFSDFEEAEIILDLNKTVPDELTCRFDVILDSGTIEHVFDMRSALMNIGRMLKPGGRVIHVTPANNYANHGFYQCSPTLLIDYYAANGYADLKAYVAEEVSRGNQPGPWELFEVNVRRQPVVMMSNTRLLAILIAEKSASSTVEKTPLQSYYANVFAPADSKDGVDDEESDSLARKLKRLIPTPLKTFVRRYLLGGTHRKPWGLKRVGRLK